MTLVLVYYLNLMSVAVKDKPRNYSEEVNSMLGNLCLVNRVVDAWNSVTEYCVT